MRCQQLLHLLNTEEDVYAKDGANSSIALHIRTCVRCQQGISQLTRALIALDALNCDQCRVRLPVYYEATRPKYPQATMPEKDMREVVLHLGHCLACQKVYQVFAELSEMEESEELIE